MEYVLIIAAFVFVIVLRVMMTRKWVEDERERRENRNKK